MQCPLSPQTGMVTEFSLSGGDISIAMKENGLKLLKKGGGIDIIKR